MFSKVKASELPPHCDYNLKIELEEDTSPPLGTLYSLSLVELSALWTFIDENLRAKPLESTRFAMFQSGVMMVGKPITRNRFMVTWVCRTTKAETQCLNAESKAL